MSLVGNSTGFLVAFGDNECGEYYELRDHEVFHQSDGRMFITDFEEKLYHDGLEAGEESKIAEGS